MVKREKKAGVNIDTENDKVTVLGEPVVYREFIYIMMNKPQDVLSATEDTHDQTVVDLLDAEFRHFKPFPVGRLDKDTEGFLLLSNDGKLAHNLLSPKKECTKNVLRKCFRCCDGSRYRKFCELG